MIFSDQRNELRQFYFNVWQQGLAKMPLDPLSQQIFTVILEHPEYHAVFNQPEKFIDKDYLPQLGEHNPFLHLGFHLAIRDQVATNRPEGITLLYGQLLKKVYPDHLTLEHDMMDILAEELWQAQKNKEVLDDQHYLYELQKLNRRPA